jgi:tetratricopeptide (TPR) repeat protein
MLHPDSLQIAEEAIEHVKRGIKLARDREKPYLFMGRLCKVTGRPEAAEKMFGRAVRIQPECVEALRELRLIEMRRRKDKGLISRLLRR